MLIKFTDVCWAQELSVRQQKLPVFDEYRIMPGDCCLVMGETDESINFLSGNKVLYINKADNHEKYECFA